MSVRQKVVSCVGAAFALSLLVPSSFAADHRFGSRLTGQEQPANSEQGVFCKNSRPQCTWVMTIARNRPNDGHLAPKDGTIRRFRLIACERGSLQIQIARLNRGETQARVVRNGPRIIYDGDSNKCRGQRFDVESFNVNIPVRKGEVLAIKTRQTSSLYCSGDNGVLRYDPPLAPGEGFRRPLNEDSCILLVEAEYAR